MLSDTHEPPRHPPAGASPMLSETAFAGLAEDIALTACGSAAWRTCRMPGQGRAVGREVIRRLNERGQAVLLIRHGLSTGASATSMAHDFLRPAGAPVAVMG